MHVDELDNSTVLCCSSELSWDYFIYVRYGPLSFAIIDFGLYCLLFCESNHFHFLTLFPCWFSWFFYNCPSPFVFAFLSRLISYFGNCVYIYSYFHWQLLSLLRNGSQYHFCLISESYELTNQSIFASLLLWLTWKSWFFVEYVTIFEDYYNWYTWWSQKNGLHPSTTTTQLNGQQCVATQAKTFKSYKYFP